MKPSQRIEELMTKDWREYEETLRKNPGALSLREPRDFWILAITKFLDEEYERSSKGQKDKERATLPLV